MIQVGLPASVEELLPVIQEILRRAVDGTVVPLVVDTTNGRILIGASSASAVPAKVEVTSGDVKIVTPGYGLILPNRSGTAYYRISVDDDGVIVADPL